MRVRRAGRSAASWVFAALAGLVLVLAAATAGLLALEAQRSARAEAERLTHGVAVTLAASPDVAAALAGPDATAALQPLAERLISEAGVDFVTVMTPDGVRVTHRDRAQIGGRYLGTIPDGPAVLTEEYTGTLGPSVRTIAPVVADGATIGWASVGVTVTSISAGFVPRLAVALLAGGALAVAGVAAALLARRLTRRVTGDLPAGAVRDAVSSYESVRTLGEALRAQTHEHGNRMHTAVSLIELGRTDEAVELLTETSRQSQALVDQVAAHDGDPTLGALLLGKAAQARERGVAWSAEVDPSAPRTALPPVDAVSVIGNLVDNALDAAAASEGRWVRVEIGAAPGGRVRVAVSDSGAGVPEALRDRVFEHGFSTKPDDGDGHGVGLALVRSIVGGAGGTVSLSDAPTTFEVVLPGRAR